MSEAVVGIDLGTTFSCVASYKNEKVEIIPDKCGDRLIRSFVYFEPKTGNVFVGKFAYELSTDSPGNGLRDIKRIIGRKFNDEFVTTCCNSNETQFSIVRGPNDMAAFEIEVNGEKIIKTPEEVSAEILKYLKKMASDYLGVEVKEAVISVPAYFNNSQRKSTRKAAELAGLKVLKLITEPTAAAIHYIKDKKMNAKLLVFDWGGGTLDVSFVEVNNKIFEVKAVNGNTLLGGRNIDDILFRHFYIPVKRTPLRFIRRLLHKCIALKEQLSSMEFTKRTMDYIDGDKDLILSMTRNGFEELTEDIFQKAFNIVETGLYDSGWTKSEISEIVLVGGTTRIPKVSKMLKSFFNIKQLKTDLNPDEAVAAGACLQAALLKNNNSLLLEKFKITEVTPLSLGLRTRGDLFSCYIRKNSRLPATGNGKFKTCNNNQENIVFQIYEGERKNCLHNNELGKFTISGLTPKRAGDVKFTINFSLDEDGILTVKAAEDSTNKSNSLVVTMGEFRLSEKNLNISLEEAKKYKVEDDIFVEFTERRLALEEQCNHILYDIGKIHSVSDRQLVEEKCREFLKYSETLNFTDTEELQATFKIMYDSITDILERYNMLELTNS